MYDFAAARRYYSMLPEKYAQICGIDTESTGLHFRHGAKPFMVSATYSDGRSQLWTARVNPRTRCPVWTSSDREELSDLVNQTDTRFVMSNKKFDVRMLNLVGLNWDPEDFLCRCDETVAMHWQLNNLESHALKDAAIKYANIGDLDESELHAATRDAAKQVAHLGWALASKTTCHIKKSPSKGWAVMDMWLCREAAYHFWEMSRAGEYWKNRSKPRKVFKDGLTEDERLAALFAGGEHLLTYTSGLCKSEMRNIQQMDGWEWHPPEVTATDVHPWYTLCGRYCSFDTLRSVVLAQVFDKQLRIDGLYDQYVENNIDSLMTYKMENFGVSINTALAKQELSTRKVDADNALNAVQFSIGPVFPINPKSPDQLRTVLYSPTGFGLPVTRYTVNKKNREAPGRPTVDKDYLTELIGHTRPLTPEGYIDEERIKLLAPPKFVPEMDLSKGQYRTLLRKWHDVLEADLDSMMLKLFAFCCSVIQYKKANNDITQIDNFLFNVLDQDGSGFGTLYPSINPYGTKTGRQSHSNPNGGNISKGGKNKKTIEFMFKVKRTLRSLFGPRPGREWWSCDYSQIELVIFAFMSEDQEMIDAFYRGRDLHDLIARRINGLPTDPTDPMYYMLEPTEEQRTIAKSGLFAYIYGAQSAKLDLTVGVSGYFDILRDTLPNAAAFIEKNEWEARRNGFVTTMAGVRLYVPENALYAATNYKIQGTASTIFKRAAYGCQHYIDVNIASGRRNTYICKETQQLRQLTGTNRDLYITLPVHDELDFDAVKGFGEQHVGALVQIMEDAAASFGVPCKVAAKLCSETWAKGKKYVFDEPITTVA